ncbi:MAG: serine--tRNA ligase [Bacteroidetes bacterium]|nr:serine--tRNA ligase [Bacteroidota bacterium]
MLTLKAIKEQPDFIIERLLVKGYNAKENIAEIIELDGNKRKVQTELDQINNQLNMIAKEVGMLFKKGEVETANIKKQETVELKAKSKKLEEKMGELEKAITSILLKMPNTPHISVPVGKSESDNKVEKLVDTKVDLPENFLPHWELAKKYDIIDFELGNKLAGAGFPVYKGLGARIQRALISFFLDMNTSAGYNEIMPPIVANEASGYGTGQLPDKEGQMYYIGEDNLYMIPTAEVPVTNVYRDSIVDEKDLPIKMTAYTPCFRREAGSYGKDVRGLNRLHQFDKVEIVQIVKPENSYDTLKDMVAHVESLIKKLELPYRLLRLCGGDISFTSALTFDFEVYSAGQDRWLEVSSVSNFESFQANRLKLRYRSGKNKELAHTLNGSSLALPRILAAILENNQTPEGIRIPKVLVPYMGGIEIIK